MGRTLWIWLLSVGVVAIILSAIFNTDNSTFEPLVSKINSGQKWEYKVVSLEMKPNKFSPAEGTCNIIESFSVITETLGAVAREIKNGEETAISGDAETISACADVTKKLAMVKQNKLNEFGAEGWILVSEENMLVTFVRKKR